MSVFSCSTITHIRCVTAAGRCLWGRHAVNNSSRIPGNDGTCQPVQTTWLITVFLSFNAGDLRCIKAISRWWDRLIAGFDLFTASVADTEKYLIPFLKTFSLCNLVQVIHFGLKCVFFHSATWRWTTRQGENKPLMSHLCDMWSKCRNVNPFILRVTP